jgi:hypothetical protein
MNPESVIAQRPATPAGRWCRLAGMVLVAGSMALCSGCVTEHPKPVARTTASKPSQLRGIDDCGLNMHDLSSYLLEYYAINRHLPQTLEELRPLVDVDKDLRLTCPVSHKPYLYYPDGLVAAGEQRKLLVVDAEPSHNGQRWAIVTLPAEGKTPLGLWVVQLKEAAAQQFHAP